MKVQNRSMMIKHCVILVLTFSIFSNCHNSQKAASLKKQYKEAYIDQFKLTYLRKLLIKGYNYSPAMQEILSIDRSGFTEPILIEEDLKLIDSLTTFDNATMRIDSAASNHRAEGSNGKRPLGFILVRIQSKWLDSLAKKRYKLSGLTKWED